MKRKYVSATDSLRPGQLDRMVSKIKDSKPCEHKNYDVKQIMDFRFRVCLDCGFQWKEDKL